MASGGSKTVIYAALVGHRVVRNLGLGMDESVGCSRALVSTL